MTKQEAKEWVKNLLARRNLEDNRGTALPIQYLLQRKVEVVADGDYSHDRKVYYHPELERSSYKTRQECRDALIEYGYELDSEAFDKACQDIRKIYLKDVWETQQAFLTEEGVRRHVQSNKHNLGEYRDYVVHAFRNWEFQELYEALEALASEEE